MTDDFNGDDELLFLDEEDSESHNETKVWRVLIVDDEEEVHSVTKLVLSGYQFAGRNIEFLDAYSAAEACDLLRRERDLAMVLLDVVMESDDAGLGVVKYIREELNNRNIRIILRTGQPGQAPEEEVISTYDINDYKDKTELTATKLKTLMYSTLRSYRDIVTLEHNRYGLERVIEASSSLFEIQSLNRFVSAILYQLTTLLHLDEDAAYVQVNSGLIATQHEGALRILTGTGQFADMTPQPAVDVLPQSVLLDIQQALEERRNLYLEGRLVVYFCTSSGMENLLYVSHPSVIHEMDKHLIEIFCSNVAIAYDNALLREDIKSTQFEIVYLLGEAVENRSQEAGNHVKRVAELCEFLARQLGFSEEEAEYIKSAAPLHDLGKIAIPDQVLNKPGRHTPEESDVMRRHVEIGYRMLKDSPRKVLQYGAIIANEHHERWDGQGYPNQKSGEEIHILGRIAAVADVFDALSSARCYKPAWPQDKVVAFFKENSGKQFDPQITQVLLDNLEQVEAIRDRHPDPSLEDTTAAAV